MVDLEEKYIDTMFEMGDIENLRIIWPKDSLLEKRTRWKITRTWLLR